MPKFKRPVNSEERMAMAVVGTPLSSTLVVVYQTGLTPTGGKTYAITVPNPRVDLVPTEVKSHIQSHFMHA